MGAAAFEVRPLYPADRFGALVTGLDALMLDDAAVAEAIRALWVDRGLIVFRGIERTLEAHLGLSRVFGEPEPHIVPGNQNDAHPAIFDLRYAPDKGNLYRIDGALVGGWQPWHKDLIYSARINRGGVLRGIVLPEQGGLTGFIDQICAYETLPDDIKTRIEGLHVVYKLNGDATSLRFGPRDGVTRVRAAENSLAAARTAGSFPEVAHPMVYAQSETGRKVLNVSQWFALRILELDKAEGDALLEAVMRHLTDEAAAYYHHWQPGDMVAWDNWRMLHRGTGVPAEARRHMQRTTIAGDYARGRVIAA